MPVMFFKLFSVDSTEITPSKVGYYMDYYISKIEEILITALASQTAQTVTFMFSNVSYMPTV